MEMEKEILVELNNVSKVIKNHGEVRRVNMNIYRGEGVAIFGQRNSGKETLSGLIDNTLKPTGGTVDYFLNSQKVMASIGIQMPNKSGPMGFKTKDVVELYRNIYGITDDTGVNELIEIFDLKKIGASELINISPLGSQIMSLFVAVIHKPEMLILEDITGQVSLDLRFRLIQFLKRYKAENNATYIFISPDSFVFDELCDRLIVLERGKIIKDSYRTEGINGDSFESIIQEVVETIKTSQNAHTADSVISGATERYIEESDILINAINAYIKPFQNMHKKDIEKGNYELIIELYNMQLFLDFVRRELVKFAAGELTRNDLNYVKESVVKLKKVGFEIDNAMKHCADIFKDNIEFQTLAVSFQNFAKYVVRDLLPFFKDRQALFNGTAVTAKLNREERLKLRVLKKKYIAEEIKLLKQESKALRRHQQLERKSVKEHAGN